jgi:hypothetical protein
MNLATEHACCDLGGQVVFRLEVTIEATVRQTGLLHDVGNADTIESPLTKKRPRDVHDPLAMSRRLLARHSHGWSLFSNPLDTIHDERHKYIYMTVIM